MKQYREFMPFVSDERASSVAIKYIKNGERFKLWPIMVEKNRYILIVFHQGLAPPRTPQLEKFNGFLVLDNNYEIVKDESQYSEIIHSFFMWLTSYIHPPVKKIPKGVYSFYKKQKMQYLQHVYEACKKRYEQNLYETPVNPLEKRWVTIFRKLDFNIINYHEMIMKFDAVIEKIMSQEKKLDKETSVENARAFFEGVKELNLIIDSYEKFLDERSKIMYEADKIMYEKLSEYSVVWKLFSGVVSLILKTPLAIVIIPVLPKFAKAIYQEIMGYRKLLRSLEGMKRLKIKFTEIIKNWEIQIPLSLMRAVAT